MQSQEEYMIKEKRNVIVGQSGGPTAAINSSLAGVYRSAKERGYKKVYGMVHGVEGLMKGHYIDLSEHIQNGLDEELLKRTPAAYLGSCRFQLPEIHEDRETFDKIFGILDDLEIDCFIYIGGNDSMDTIKKLSDYGMLTGSKVRFVGCPKTIDNDLALTDHTPGYGSAAKYIGTSVKEIIRDGMSILTAHGTVTIVEIMGRNAGWLTGAACLAEGEDCTGPDAIYLPEIAFDVDKFVEKCEKPVRREFSRTFFPHALAARHARSSSPLFREQLPTVRPVSISLRLQRSAVPLLLLRTKVIQERWSFSYVQAMIRIRRTPKSRMSIRSPMRSALSRESGSMRKVHM